ncbi:MAG TPA: SOS response-associated peptidase [Polyangiaceae bacterium]|nr:SOS response-associated peptidase [Polyangiaceae bacterium]
MCGRFSEEAELSEIKLELKIEQLELFREFRPLYNIAPSYGPANEQLFVVQTRDGKRALRLGRWWMIPHFWSKPLKALPAAFNARAEELPQKPFWRDAFRQHRCLVPATGWREFKPEGKRKQPYQFRLERRLFAFAGLWSRWTSPDGELIDSFAIVTTEPTAKAAEYHDRMPLVLPPDLYDAWLDRASDPTELLLEARARAANLELDVFPSNPLGNNVRFEGPEVVERFDPATAPPPEPTRTRARQKRPAVPQAVDPRQQSLFAEPEAAVPRKQRR